MLGAERDIIATYVANGDVKIAFWPVLDHGQRGVDITAASYCLGQQDPLLFWQAHDLFFERQSELWGGDRDYLMATAREIGAEETAFAQCYDSGATYSQVLALDNDRREQGIRQRPTIDINGQKIFGSQRFDVFANVIEEKLP